MARRLSRVIALLCLSALLAQTLSAAGPDVWEPAGVAATTRHPAGPEAGRIGPSVVEAMAAAEPNELIPVIVTLEKQAELGSIPVKDRDERVRAVVRLLRETAKSQAGIRSYVETTAAGGLTARMEPFWIFNGFAVSATALVIEALASRSDVASVSLDETFSAPSLSVDQSEIEPNLAASGVSSVWERGYRGQGVVVASMDTGVSLSHPDLAASWRGGANSWFDPNGEHPNTPVDPAGHGTAITGVMVGGEAGGTAIGVAPEAEWIAVKIFDDAGEATASDVHRGYQWLLDPDDDPNTADAPHVVNNSWTYSVPGCSLEFQLDLQALRAAGILPVFSAGNTGPSPSVNVSPANNPEAFAAGAVNNFDQIYYESGRGPSNCGEPETIFPELVAPGVDIRSTGPQGTYMVVSGTSLAAPHIAGALALLLSAYPDLSVEEQVEALLEGSRDLGPAGPDNVFGYGRLDVLGALESLAPSATTDIIVETTSDVVASDEVCSLREAVVAANTDSAFQECPAGSGTDRILFSPALSYPATFTLAVGGRDEDGSLTGDLDVEGTLIISATQPVVIDAAGVDRVFDVRPGAHATMSGLTLTGGDPGPGAVGGGVRVFGRLSLSDSEVAQHSGDGLYADGGFLELMNVTVSDNTGSGIRQVGTASLVFADGLVELNDNGGIRSSYSTASLARVTVAENAGGGVFNMGTGTLPAQLTMSGCEVLTNTADTGAGIFSQGARARATIRGTRIAGNVATGAGGGVYNSGMMRLEKSVLHGNQARSGGGVDHSGVSLSMSNVTVSGNVADDNGGGLHNRGDAVLTSLTFSGNAADAAENGGNIFNDEAQLSLGNTIVASAASGGNCFNSQGFFNSLGHNLDSGDTCGFNTVGDLVNTDPLLGPLRDNGGDTLTHALMAGSPAIDAGDDISCLDEDQRGVPRPQGDQCDIGAYEYVPGVGADVSISKAADPEPVLVGGVVTYTLGLGNMGPDLATMVRVTDTLPVEAAFQSLDANGWACDHVSGLVTCSRSDLSAGAETEIVIRVTAPMTTSVLLNEAWIGAAEADPNPTDNHAAVTTLVVTEAFSEVFLPAVLK